MWSTGSSVSKHTEEPCANGAATPNPWRGTLVSPWTTAYAATARRYSTPASPEAPPIPPRRSSSGTNPSDAGPSGSRRASSWLMDVCRGRHHPAAGRCRRSGAHRLRRSAPGRPRHHHIRRIEPTRPQCPPRDRAVRTIAPRFRAGLSRPTRRLSRAKWYATARTPVWRQAGLRTGSARRHARCSRVDPTRRTPLESGCS